MDRKGTVLALSGAVWAQLTGIWTSWQSEVALTKRFSTQLQVQPRLVPLLPPQQMEVLVTNFFLWYRIRRHGFSAEVNRAWIWHPRQATQWRFRMHWRWRPFSTLPTRLTLEQRWEGPQVIERMVRPQAEYAFPLGGRLHLALRQELLLYGWNPQKGWHAGLRQSRSWLFLRSRLGALRLETGYLIVAAPQRLPRHNLWIGVGWDDLIPLPLHGNDTTDPATSAQTPPPESPAGSPPP